MKKFFITIFIVLILAGFAFCGFYIYRQNNEIKMLKKTNEEIVLKQENNNKELEKLKTSLKQKEDRLKEIENELNTSNSENYTLKAEKQELLKQIEELNALIAELSKLNMPQPTICYSGSINWAPVKNATEYRVEIEQNGVMQTVLTNENSINLRSYSLAEGTIIRVYAVGNGIFKDSDGGEIVINYSKLETPLCFLENDVLTITNYNKKTTDSIILRLFAGENNGGWLHNTTYVIPIYFDSENVINFDLKNSAFVNTLTNDGFENNSEVKLKVFAQKMNGSFCYDSDETDILNFNFFQAEFEYTIQAPVLSFDASNLILTMTNENLNSEGTIGLNLECKNDFGDYYSCGAWGGVSEGFSFRFVNYNEINNHLYFRAYFVNEENARISDYSEVLEIDYYVNALSSPIINYDDMTKVISWEAIEGSLNYTVLFVNENGIRYEFTVNDCNFNLLENSSDIINGVYTVTVTANNETGNYISSLPSESIYISIVN